MKNFKEEYYKQIDIRNQLKQCQDPVIYNYVTELKEKVKSQEKEINLKHLTPKQK